MVYACDGVFFSDSSSMIPTETSECDSCVCISDIGSDLQRDNCDGVCICISDSNSVTPTVMVCI